MPKFCGFCAQPLAGGRAAAPAPAAPIAVARHRPRPVETDDDDAPAEPLDIPDSLGVSFSVAAPKSKLTLGEVLSGEPVKPPKLQKIKLSKAGKKAKLDEFRNYMQKTQYGGEGSSDGE